MISSDLEELLSGLYHTLRATRRRYVIQFLNESSQNSRTTRELARKIASREWQMPEPQATGEPYRNAYNALSQTHLPTLCKARIIIYDPKRQTVSQGVNFELAVLLLDINTPLVGVFVDLTDQDLEEIRTTNHNHR